MLVQVKLLVAGNKCGVQGSQWGSFVVIIFRDAVGSPLLFHAPEKRLPRKSDQKISTLSFAPSFYGT
jgi:hypothetical protein